MWSSPCSSSHLKYEAASSSTTSSSCSPTSSSSLRRCAWTLEVEVGVRAAVGVRVALGGRPGDLHATTAVAAVTGAGRVPAPDRRLDWRLALGDFTPSPCCRGTACCSPSSSLSTVSLSLDPATLTAFGNTRWARRALLRRELVGVTGVTGVTARGEPRGEPPGDATRVPDDGVRRPAPGLPTSLWSLPACRALRRRALVGVTGATSASSVALAWGSPAASRDERR